MYGYIFIILGVFSLGLAALTKRQAERASRREAEEHTRFLIETYGGECCRRAFRPREKTRETSVPAGKEVAS